MLEAAILEEAIGYYNFINPQTVFIRHNENMTYAVTDGENKYLLRIHKAAEELDFSFFEGEFPREAYIEGEIELLLKLQDACSFKTQYPIKNKDGSYITHLQGGILATVLSWLDGEDLTQHDITDELAFRIGQTVGELHKSADKLASVKRYCYDEELIRRTSAEIRNAFIKRHIEESQYILIEELLVHIIEILSNEKNNYILIHSDISKSNMIYNESAISPIDFSLSGYGIPEMELGQMIASFNNNLMPSLLAGYESISNYSVNRDYIEIFIAFSVIQYIAIHHNKGYREEKFVKAMDRWCNTLFAPAVSKASELLDKVKI